MTSPRIRPQKPQTDAHPFFCAKRKCRKTAWDTPEYLTPLDRALIARLVTVTSAEELCNVVYERDTPKPSRAGHDEGFFWRVVGWPEGRNYMQNAEYSQSVFVSVKAMIRRAAHSIGLNCPDQTNFENPSAPAVH